MDDVRRCAYCGAAFTPRREHARFCSAACRVAWHRAETGDPVAPRALQWSVPGMSSAVQKLAVVDGSDRSAAFDAIADAVWAVTIVDAALVRYHPGAYDDLLAAATPTDRELVERTLAGVRFVRNQIAGQAEVASFVAPPAVDPVAGGGLMDWTWRPVSEPEHIGRAPRARSWETSRYRGYRSALAGHTVKEIFARAEEFLLGAAANAGLITEVAVRGTSPGLLPGVREG